jgi:hypothetical protein
LAELAPQPQIPLMQLNPDGHALPHAPQLAGVVLRSVSQPSSAAGAAGWLQLPFPGEQVELHRPAAHVAVFTPPFAQARWQAPQLPASLLRSVSQPP